MKAMATAARQHLAKCVETVRTNDRWHFLCSTFLSPERRANSLIVHALNCELDQISAKSTKARFSSLKFKWWVDAVAKVAGGDAVPNHPVVSLLPRVVGDSRPESSSSTRSCKPSWNWWKSRSGFARLPGVRRRERGGHLLIVYYLLLESSGARQPEVLDAASHMGKGVGLALLLKSIPQDALKDKVLLPSDLCRDAKVNYGSVTAGYNSDELSEVVYRVATRAKHHLDESRRAHNSLCGDARPFLLPLIPALRYLERLERRVRAVHAVFARRRSVGPQTKVLCGLGQLLRQGLSPDSHHLGQLNMYSPATPQCMFDNCKTLS